MKNRFSTTPAGIDIGVYKKRKTHSVGSEGVRAQLDRHHPGVQLVADTMSPGDVFSPSAGGDIFFTMSRAIDCHHLPRENLSPAAGLMFVTVQFSSWAGAIFVHCDSVSPSAEVNCCSP